MIRVLVVDDNSDAAESLAMLLELSGHEVRVAYSGAEVLQEPRDVPDVAVVDIGLPGLDGYELARRLRRMARWTGSQLFALSGWGRPEDKQRAVEAGFDCHLTKPVEVETLDQLIRERARDARDCRRTH